MIVKDCNEFNYLVIIFVHLLNSIYSGYRSVRTFLAVKLMGN